MKLKFTFFAAILLLNSTESSAEEKTMKPKQTDRPAIVFLVAGQSNAGGCGVLSPELHKKLGRDEKLPLVAGSTASEVGLSTDAASYTHSYIWTPREGFQRVDPMTNCQPSSNPRTATCHGMELPVIRELEKQFPDNDIFVIKHGPGSTSLHNHWNPESKDGQYAIWLKYYRQGMAQLSRGYPEVRVVGVYWDQGESDGVDGKAAEYGDNLRRFISVVRRDTGIPQLRFFIRKHLFNWPNIDQIIAAQKEVVAKDTRCYLLDIDMGDRTKNYEAWAYSPGNPHLSSKGFVELSKCLFGGPLRNATLDSFDKPVAP